MRRGRKAGFTLLETVIALAVISIAMTGFLIQSGYSARTAIHVRDKTLAAWVAQNHLTQLELTGELQPLEDRHGSALMGHRTWFWRQRARGTGVAGLQEVEIAVFLAPPAADRPLRDASALVNVTGFVRERGG